jgi:hypothetical protein
MNLKIIQFNYGHLGGAASIHIGHDQVISAFEQPSYVGVHCGYHVVPSPSHDVPDNHVQVQIPGSQAWLNLCVLWAQPVNWPSRTEVPAMSAYKVQIARLIANMIANATLSDLGQRIPDVLI